MVERAKKCVEGVGSFQRKIFTNYRAYKSKGQRTVSDLARICLGTAISEWSLGTDAYTSLYKKARRIIQKEAVSMGIDRYVIDSAGRKHLFFNNGEAMQVKDAVAGSIAQLTMVSDNIGHQ
jgi:hypothetical protein